MGFPLILKVDVTQEDIDYGTRGSTSRCAVSRAIKRHYPNASVYTNMDGVQINNAVSYASNESLAEVVKLYDNHGFLEPRTLYLRRND